MNIEEKINELKDRMNQLEDRILKLEEILKTQPSKIEKNLSIKELILEKDPQDDIQRTLVIGYYLEKYDRLKSFNKSDIEEGFRKAREPVPDNINYKVIRNIKKGHLMETREKKDKLKTWCLTNTGEKIIEDGFKNE